ncbi:MAG: N-ethylammeline chlorohydrolase [Acidimicrobiaceae bacterium]|nr:N-ethylammeline chlorohydrolase [Acidimicrobiaceae bacterium]
MNDTVLIQNATILSPERDAPLEGSVLVEGTTIAAVGDGPASADVVIDGRGCLVVPGFVQAHVHFCQTLFRGVADDLDVMDWLREWIWPLEQAHDHASVGASAALSIAELLLGGTTTTLSMETVHHTDASFEAAERLGIRAFIGKAIMDRNEPGIEMLGEDTDAAWADVEALLERWHGAADDRLRVALSPRAPIGATDEMWRRCVAAAQDRDLVLHTHVNENRDQARLVAAGRGTRDVEALHELGALTPRLVMAHSVWLDPNERDLVRRHRPTVCHCPSANMKLASGRAPVDEYLADGVNVALGADGAPCNNRLDAFTEMRLAAIIHKPVAGPRAVPARVAFDMATMGGARAVGLADRIGSIEVGKRADLVVIERGGAHVAPIGRSDPFSQLVYAHTAADVRDVLVEGRAVVRDRTLTTGSVPAITAEAERQIDRLFVRLGRAT